MIIKILGTGCPNCKKLEANTREALKQLDRNGEVVKVTEMSEIMGYGVMSLPALVFDEKVMTYGIIPSVEDIKKIINKNA